METGLDEGPPLPKHVIDYWRDFAIINDWKTGLSLRAVAAKHGVSHEKVRVLVRGHIR